jgi:phosphoglycolate phosphatase
LGQNDRINLNPECESGFSPKKNQETFTCWLSFWEIHNIISIMSLILFDFDGVLADTLADMLRFAQQVCDELGVKHTVVQTDLSELEVMSFATFGRACEIPEGLVDEFVSRCTQKFAEKNSPPAIFNGLGEVVRKLAQTHVLAVVTGNTESNVRAFLEAHGLEACFSKVYGVDMPGSKVEKILMAKHQFTARDEVVFMVGDSVSDISQARQAGVTSIAVSWGHQSMAMLVGAAPDHFVHRPDELIDITSHARVRDRSSN